MAPPSSSSMIGRSTAAPGLAPGTADCGLSSASSYGTLSSASASRTDRENGQSGKCLSRCMHHALGNGHAASARSEHLARRRTTRRGHGLVATPSRIADELQRLGSPSSGRSVTSCSRTRAGRPTIGVSISAASSTSNSRDCAVPGARRMRAPTTSGSVRTPVWSATPSISRGRPQRTPVGGLRHWASARHRSTILRDGSCRAGLNAHSCAPADGPD